jgi:hypothetical protein
MLKRGLFCSAVALTLAAPVQAEVGVGIIVGEPTGLSIKSWFSRMNALHIGAGWDMRGNNSEIRIKADYLVHNYSLFPVRTGKLPFYFGVGAHVNASRNATIGVRVPVGLNYMFAGAPLDVFLEIAPTLNLAPATEFNMGAAMGIHYRF